MLRTYSTRAGKTLRGDGFPIHLLLRDADAPAEVDDEDHEGEGEDEVREDSRADPLFIGRVAALENVAWNLQHAVDEEEDCALAHETIAPELGLRVNGLLRVS